MEMSLAVRDCQPRINSSSLPLDSRNAPRGINSSLLCLRSPIPMDSNDILGRRKELRCSFLCRNQFHSTFLDDAITIRNNAELEADAITLATSTSSQNVPQEQEQVQEQVQEQELGQQEEQLEEHQQGQEQMQQQLPLGCFVRPKPVPDSKSSGFLRAFARSLEHCSERIAAGFGLSRQPTAWYKHCWHAPGSQSERIHELGRLPKSMTNWPATKAAIPTNMPSSTTL